MEEKKEAAKYCEREVQILLFVAEHPGSTSMQVADGCLVTHNNAIKRLLHYYRRNWVSREPPRYGKAFKYMVTKSGEKRLNYLRGS